ncbi:hypothetical protein EDC04DRAFT_2600319 [Pisolithus marmoratus]|nr:hypothetical protein EDC04DRAFT_2600319 [Pisolithus marmoratus]
MPELPLIPVDAPKAKGTTFKGTRSKYKSTIQAVATDPSNVLAVANVPVLAPDPKPRKHATASKSEDSQKADNTNTVLTVTEREGRSQLLFNEEDLHNDGNLECVKNSLEKILQTLGRGKEENWDLEWEDGADSQQSESDGGEAEDDFKEVETNAEGAA